MSATTDDRRDDDTKTQLGVLELECGDKVLYETENPAAFIKIDGEQVVDLDWEVLR